MMHIMTKKELENRIKTLLNAVNAEIEALKNLRAVMIQERFRVEELLKEDTKE